MAVQKKETHKFGLKRLNVRELNELEVRKRVSD